MIGLSLLLFLLLYSCCFFQFIVNYRAWLHCYCFCRYSRCATRYTFFHRVKRPRRCLVCVSGCLLFVSYISYDHLNDWAIFQRDYESNVCGRSIFNYVQFARTQSVYYMHQSMARRPSVRPNLDTTIDLVSERAACAHTQARERKKSDRYWNGFLRPNFPKLAHWIAEMFTTIFSTVNILRMAYWKCMSQFLIKRENLHFIFAGQKSSRK